jgi:hypothetical protein
MLASNEEALAMDNQREIFYTCLMFVGLLGIFAAVPAGAFFGFDVAAAVFSGGSLTLLLSGVILAIYSSARKW